MNFEAIVMNKEKEREVKKFLRMRGSQINSPKVKIYAMDAT